jgi:hypothetical protein
MNIYLTYPAKNGQKKKQEEEEWLKLLVTVSSTKVIKR